MDRLTIPYPDGAIELKCSVNGAVARLAAYEDTGLEPEEAEVCKVALMGKTLAEITEFEGIPMDCMIELAKAESEGRLIVLPEGLDRSVCDWLRGVINRCAEAALGGDGDG